MKFQTLFLPLQKTHYIPHLFIATGPVILPLAMVWVGCYNLRAMTIE